MSTVEHLSPIEANKVFSWQEYLLDSVLALVGALFVTAIIFTFHLYPGIPNISIVYLLVVIGLAATRGRYAAILASLVAFLAFDFFIVPPLYTFTMYRIEEWVALFVFLASAILTGQLAAALRESAKEAARHERETRILYDLVRATNREEDLPRQLNIVARAFVNVFSSWGVSECAILLPDERGKLTVQASTDSLPANEQANLSRDEEAAAAWVLAHGQSVRLHDIPIASASALRVLVGSTKSLRTAHRSLRLLPLKIGQKVVGVFRLLIDEYPRRFPTEQHLSMEYERPNPQTAFFWTFLDQASTMIEQARLRQESLQVEVLRRTDTLRAALLSSVSHDLRTPLTSIKAAASSLLQEDVQWDDETRRGFARAIEHEADRLNRLVSNLLDMSRIEEGALRPEKEWYSLVALVHDVLGRLEPLLEGRLVQTHLPGDLLLVELDYMQIDQVLTNLLENAIRYTPAESAIEVSAHVEGEQVTISVADRGPGIPRADLERVFDKFYRVLHDGHPGGYPSGSGLGLAVCKGLVEAHGGRIWAERRDGGGLIIFVVLPVGERERMLL